MKGERHAAESDLQLLGIYHSHPNHPAVPSEHDRVAAQPFFSYVIISTESDGVKNTRSWILNDNSQFDEEEYNPAAPVPETLTGKPKVKNVAAPVSLSRPTPDAPPTKANYVIHEVKPHDTIGKL